MEELASQVVKNMITSIFYIVQTLSVAVIIAVFKMFFDVKQHGRDIDQAFKKIRNLEDVSRGTIEP